MATADLDGRNYVRKAFAIKGMSEAAINLAIALIAESTLRQYKCPLKKWNIFCSKRNINPFEINFTQIQDFLTEIFSSGASSNTINTYRSALAMILGPKIAYYSRMKRIRKAASQLRPPCPKYDVTWDPKIVLNVL